LVATGLIWAPAAGAATVNCGEACISPYSEAFGTDYVLAVSQGRQAAGQPIVLSLANNLNSAEDWTYSAQGTVSDFYAAGLVSAALNLHYGSDEAYEFEYTPNGVGTVLCLGVAAAAANNTAVSLQTCGVSAKTLWVVDGTDSDGIGVPLINGSDTNFSQPYVLTYPAGKSPISAPSTQLVTYALQRNTSTGINLSQMWAFEVGVLPQGGS